MSAVQRSALAWWTRETRLLEVLFVHLERTQTSLKHRMHFYILKLRFVWEK